LTFPPGAVLLFLYLPLETWDGDTASASRARNNVKIMHSMALRLTQAQAGDAAALGAAFEACRAYLLMVANASLPADLRAKGGASDLVQEAFLDAHRHAGNFHGTTEGELLAWLGEILRCRVANFLRDYRHTAKRQVGREVDLDAGAEPADDQTPSAIASQEEDVRRLEQAIARLPGDYREVVRLRYREHRSFEEIAPLLRRSLDATRQLWKRAIRQLRAELSTP
jgi:RNA polymerase sigma-70 factor (ECF subfamily)